MVRVLLTVEVSVYFAAWTTTASVCEEPLVHIKSVARQRILEASEFLVFCGENIGFTARRTGISGVFFRVSILSDSEVYSVYGVSVYDESAF